jgi:hypothetical protein
VPTPRLRPILRIPIPATLRVRIRASIVGSTGRRPSLVPLVLLIKGPAFQPLGGRPRRASLRIRLMWIRPEPTSK